jgi:hypothetical protein
MGAARAAPAQISAATGHRWRQCSVSMKNPLSTRPHHAPKTGAELKP